MIPLEVGLSFLGVFVAMAIVLAVFFIHFVKFVDRDQQIVIDGLTEKVVLNGPRVVILPLLTKSSQISKALSLASTEYCLIKNVLSGRRRVVVGPQLVFLEAYDHLVKDHDRRSGSEKLEKRSAISLKANEFVRFVDNNTGKVRVIQGEQGCVVPGPDEVFMDVGQKRKAMELQVFEYVKVQDKRTGAVRVERGEKLVFLGPFEEYLGSKQNAIEVDDETAVLVRNKRTGQQHLVTEKELFVPNKDEQILEVRKLTKLADYEACIVRDKSGRDIFYFGKNEEQRSFFLPPYSEIVSLCWSRGRRRERRDLHIAVIDMRPMYMSFEFNCRTNDNVELVLEGSFFWEIVDLQAMLKFTNDTTGDICNHARSRFIELVSKVTLQEFMTQFNKIAERVHMADDSDFYDKRGVKIHSLEVTGYHCADASTAHTLSEIIQETTNRINRLQQQESENEVQLREIRGDIEEEKARAELLEIQQKNSDAKAEMEGSAEAQRVKSFLRELATTTFGDNQHLDMKDLVRLWSILRKEDALKAVSQGNAKLFFTPKDANLSIENHEHNNNAGMSDEY